ncbi:PadR family transcriptional regulator [Fulvivirga lutimaris]|uniref:PadR family transcriptional regulator n=1 Tax=Fulvivirga lutimaris TaxID=1819566 RepID=UPI0012BC1088|nr:PadR family transcriptional regulator [Fulvivirga lutimaris]MTI38484.1 PadR family transcriptional regulator [Fulvivirga lutimaris]
MKGNTIGEFEELVLLTIASLTNDAYSVAICDHLSEYADRKVKLGVVHSSLNRLEEKGLIKSSLGEPTQERGGRRKRFYELTHAGIAAVRNAKEIRDRIWSLIPSFVLKG